MTPDTLHLATGCLPVLSEIWAAPLTSAFDEYEINTPALNAVLERVFAADARLSLSVDYPLGVSLALDGEPGNPPERRL